jgi:formate hydrogenlyase subunit 4
VIATILHVALLLAAPPFLAGVINRTKAIVAGRRGPPVLQVYFDLWRLVRKGAVYSRVTTWVFPAGPLVGLAATLCAGLLVPIAALPAPLAFDGDLLLFAALLALGRFVTILAALDTGSSFEGMGASREASFGSLAEPLLFACFLVLAIGTKSLCLTTILGPELSGLWGRLGPALLLLSVSFGLLLLVENCRIPVDDPSTHLELTMIHEVMVLDHSGPDFAMITYGATMKLFVFAAMLARLLLPTATGVLALDALASAAGIVVIGIAIGVVESSMARLRLPRVPTFLGGGLVLASIAIAVLFSIGGSR